MTRVVKLTGDAGPAIVRAVQRLLGLFAVMALLLSVGMAPLAHATERLCLPGGEAAAAIAGHVDGDGDQAPDTEKGFAHHHGGCHGHHFAGPVAHTDAEAPAIDPARFLSVRSAILPSALADKSLRPPIA